MHSTTDKDVRTWSDKAIAGPGLGQIKYLAAPLGRLTFTEAESSILKILTSLRCNSDSFLVKIRAWKFKKSFTLT